MGVAVGAAVAGLGVAVMTCGVGVGLLKMLRCVAKKAPAMIARISTASRTGSHHLFPGPPPSGRSSTVVVVLMPLGACRIRTERRSSERDTLS